MLSGSLRSAFWGRISQRNQTLARRLNDLIGGMLKASRKFDINDDLLREVFKQNSWAELTQNEGKLPVKLMTRNILEAQSELRLPFKHCWMEFSGYEFNKHMESLGWTGGLSSSSVRMTRNGSTSLIESGFC